MRGYKEGMTSNGGGGQTDDAGESWNGGKYDGTQKVERGKRERCDRIFGGKRWDRIRRKKESGRQKPESDRHRWQRDDCPNLQQVSVQTGAFRQSCWYSLHNSVENKLSACRITRYQSKWNTLLTLRSTWTVWRHTARHPVSEALSCQKTCRLLFSSRHWL